MLGVQFFFVFYFMANFPFKNYIHNYRAGLIHITVLVILLTSNYYSSMKLNTPMSIKSRLYGQAIIKLSLIGLCVGLSLIRHSMSYGYVSAGINQEGKFMRKILFKLIKFQLLKTANSKKV